MGRRWARGGERVGRCWGRAARGRGPLSTRRIPVDRMRGTASRHCGVAPACDLAAALEHLAVLHHEVDVLENGDVLQRVALYRDDLAALPAPDRPAPPPPPHHPRP